VGSLVRANCFKYSLYFIIRHNAGLAYSLPKLIKSIMMIFRVTSSQASPSTSFSCLSKMFFDRLQYDHWIFCEKPLVSN